jgi:phospholipid-translocating ATPase
VGQNRTPPPVKVARSDEQINKFTVLIFVVQLGIALLLGVLGYVNDSAGSTDDGRWYLFNGSMALAWGWLVFPLRFLLLNSMMIPISLKVTLDIVKLYYAKMIDSDSEMYDEQHNTPANAVNTSISETLGQVLGSDVFPAFWLALQ